MKRQAKQIVAGLMAMIMLIHTPAYAGAAYGDTAGHWAADAIDRWSDYGIVEGDDGAFMPDTSVTRGQMAKILSELLNLTKTPAENPFSDVAEDAWYTPYVLRCFTAGIMQGADGMANPNASITREEAMTMIGRALEITPVERADLNAYPDAKNVAPWASGYVTALTEAKIVNGIDGDLKPLASISRASMMTIIDRAISQYINTPGTFALEPRAGIVLIAASGDVELTGTTQANILVSPAGTGRTVALSKATVMGTLTVQADDCRIVAKSSDAMKVVMLGAGSKVEAAQTGKTAAPSSGGGGGHTAPANLTVSTPGSVMNGGTYVDVTIASAVGNGNVTLNNVTINGNLIVQGGGSESVYLDSCAIAGKVTVDKDLSAEGAQTPRLVLTQTPVTSLKADSAAIIEAQDDQSAVTAMEAKANVEVRGEQTSVGTILVPEALGTPVAITVTSGNVGTVEAKSVASVSGAANSVSKVVAEASVSVDSAAVAAVEVPSTADDEVAVNVTGTENIAVTINKETGVMVTADDIHQVTVTTTELDKVPEVVAVNEHEHAWGAGNFCAICGEERPTLNLELAETFPQYRFSGDNGNGGGKAVSLCACDLSGDVDGSAQYRYQWYSCDDINGANPVLIEGAIEREYTTSPFERKGVNYNKCVITVNVALGSGTFSEQIETGVYCVAYTGLPTVYVNTPNSAEITSKDEWMEGATISVSGADHLEWDFKPVSTSIKGRGNTTWGQPKKPYALKLDKKQEVLGMPKSKRWVLIANFLDNSFMRNAMAFYLSKQFQMDYTVRGEYVDLVLNGSYQGLYWLGEAIKVDSKRVNIDEDADYLIEMDLYYDEAWKFHSSLRNLPYMIKNDDTMSEERLDSLQTEVNALEQLLYPGEGTAPDEIYTEILDVDSWAKFWLINEIMSNDELGHPKSCYFTYDSANQVLKAGPVWDYDWASLSRSDSCRLMKALYYDALFKSETFRQAVKEVCDSYSSEIKIANKIESLRKQLYTAQMLDATRWPAHLDPSGIARDSFDDYVDFLKETLMDKYDVVMEMVNSLELGL